MQLLYACFSSFWRRWFGSKGLIGKADAWYDSRPFKYIIGCLITSVFLFYKEYNWIQIIAATSVLYFFYWAKGFACAFDMSRAGYPGEQTIKDYKKFFWNKWCEFLVPKDKWYGFGYDFLWMLFRYEIPAILISVILLNGWFLLSGVCVAFAYAIGWALSDSKAMKELGPTEFGEVVGGFFTGVFLQGGVYYGLW